MKACSASVSSNENCFTERQWLIFSCANGRSYGLASRSPSDLDALSQYGVLTNQNLWSEQGQHDIKADPWTDQISTNAYLYKDPAKHVTTSNGHYTVEVKWPLELSSSKRYLQLLKIIRVVFRPYIESALYILEGRPVTEFEIELLLEGLLWLPGTVVQHSGLAVLIESTDYIHRLYQSTNRDDLKTYIHLRRLAQQVQMALAPIEPLLNCRLKYKWNIVETGQAIPF